MTYRYSLIALTLSGLCAVATPSVAYGDKSAHESLLPGRVLGFVTIHDATKATDQLNEFVNRQFGEDCREFRDSVKANRAQISEQLRGEVGIAVDELSELKLGQMTIAAVKIEDQPVSVVLLIDFESRVLVDGIVQRLATALQSAEFSRSESTIARTQINVFQRQDPARELVVGIRDSVLCLSTSTTTFTELMRGWEAHAGTLSISPAYRSVIQNCQPAGTNPLFTWFADPMGLLKESVIYEEQDSALRRFALEMMSRTGVDQLKAAGGTFDVNDEKFVSVGRMQLVLDRPVTGIPAMFRLKSEDRPQTQLLKNAVSYLSFNWDLKSFFEGSAQLLEIIQGPGTLDAYLDRVQSVSNGFDPKRDLLDKLTGRVHLANIVHDGEQRLLVALQVADPKAIGDLLDQTTRVRFEFAVERTTARKFGGLTVYKQPFGDSRVYLALIGDMLCVSSGEAVIAGLESEVESVGESGSTDYERVSRIFPSKCVAHSFDSQQEQFQELWKWLRTRSPKDMMGLDFSVLPTFATIKSRLGPSGGFGIENETGVLFTHFTLSPAPHVE